MISMISMIPAFESDTLNSKKKQKLVCCLLRNKKKSSKIDENLMFLLIKFNLILFKV